MADDADEVPLAGGYVNDVVRVGDTVRRKLIKPRPFAQEVLTFLEREGYEASPRFRGFDNDGREILSFIEGTAPYDLFDGWVDAWSTAAVARVAELSREFHDLTAGTPLAGDEEVVCHNDLSPRNTVYEPDTKRPIAFIDWDLAEPGRRVHDLALICWQWACSVTSTLDSAVALVVAAADAYRCSDSDRSELIATVLWWQDRCWRGIQDKIDAEDPTADRLKAADAVTRVQADYEWTALHRAALEAALSR